MAKWSNIYLDDSLKLLKKVEKKLAKVVEEVPLEKDVHFGQEMEEECRVQGRRELAKELQAKIKKWRKQMFNEEGEK